MLLCCVMRHSSHVQHLTVISAILHGCNRCCSIERSFTFALQVLASDVQERLEAATRFLLALQDVTGHKAQELELRLAIASSIGREWHSSQLALDKALKAATLTHGEGYHLAPYCHRIAHKVPAKQLSDT